jgi:dTDP-4-dehydrorhamnose reductase
MRIYGTAGTMIEQAISDVSTNMLVIRTSTPITTESRSAEAADSQHRVC